MHKWVVSRKYKEKNVFLWYFTHFTLSLQAIMDITERFINYTQFDTQSAEDSDTVPSTAKQLVFAEYLKKELEHEGLSDVEMDEKGYIVADETGATSIPGVFAAGDVRTKQLRQVVTAVADGANAVTSVEKYLLTL
jgi:thioredoxin reductase